MKRRTRSGEAVVITDAKESLWALRAAGSVESDPARDRAIDKILDQALRTPRSTVSAARLLE